MLGGCLAVHRLDLKYTSLRWLMLLVPRSHTTIPCDVQIGFSPVAELLSSLHGCALAPSLPLRDTNARLQVGRPHCFTLRGHPSHDLSSKALGILPESFP